MPTEKAHGIQIVKTCEALADYGVKVELLVPDRKNPIKDDPFEFYKIAKNFAIKKVPCLDLINIPFLKKITFWLESFTFYLSVKNILLKINLTHTIRVICCWLFLSKQHKNVFTKFIFAGKNSDKNT
jgi:hypothetical protein